MLSSVGSGDWVTLVEPVLFGCISLILANSFVNSIKSLMFSAIQLQYGVWEGITVIKKL